MQATATVHPGVGRGHVSHVATEAYMQAKRIRNIRKRRIRRLLFDAALWVLLQASTMARRRTHDVRSRNPGSQRRARGRDPLGNFHRRARAEPLTGIRDPPFNARPPRESVDQSPESRGDGWHRALARPHLRSIGTPGERAGGAGATIESRNAARPP